MKNQRESPTLRANSHEEIQRTTHWQNMGTERAS